MAFKSMEDYNKQRFNGLFTLRDNGDSADVIFLYRSPRDCLVADTHYIKSEDYSGYVHCCGRGCPACGNNIRIQTKLFIPMYNITNQAVEFWDRNIRFEHQLNKDVFDKYPNACDYIFRITRHGVANDVNTTYEIQAIAKNTYKTYDAILAENHISFPEYYETICREVTATELSNMLNSRSSGSSVTSGESIGMPEYQITPRVTPRSVEAPVNIPLPADDSDIVDAFETVDIPEEEVDF